MLWKRKTMQTEYPHLAARFAQPDAWRVSAGRQA